MWVTQTYMCTIESRSLLYVYYFFEDYNSSQKRFTQRLQKEMEMIGDVYGEKVSLMFPNPRYRGKIEAEVRELPWLWSTINGKLPGVLIADVPLKDLQENSKIFYICFETEEVSSVVEVIKKIRKISDEYILDKEKINKNFIKKDFFGRLFDAIEIKPGIWGISLDIKKILNR